MPEETKQYSCMLTDEIEEKLEDIKKYLVTENRSIAIRYCVSMIHKQLKRKHQI